jgi:uncharacterized protein (DUF433 family)
MESTHYPHIVLGPKGMPMVRGTQVCVHRLFAWFDGGTAADVILKRYPNVSQGQLFCALGFAFDHPSLMQHWIQEERAALARQALKAGPGAAQNGHGAVTK